MPRSPAWEVTPLHFSSKGVSAPHPPCLSGRGGYPSGHTRGYPPPGPAPGSGRKRRWPSECSVEAMRVSVQERWGGHPSGHERGGTPSRTPWPGRPAPTPPPSAGGGTPPPVFWCRILRAGARLRRENPARNSKGGGRGGGPGPGRGSPPWAAGMASFSRWLRHVCTA